MAAVVLTDATVLCHGYDFSGDLNGVQLDTDVDGVDVTNFRSGGWKEFKPGLKDLKFSEKGFWSSAQASSGSVDTETFPDLGVVDRVFTVSPQAAATSVAYLFQGAKSGYKLFGVDVGQPAPFTLDAVNTDPVGVVRGLVAAARQSVSGTGPLGSGVQLGAPTSTQFVYATFHVLPPAGTTITVQVQSDDNSGFTTPVTRATIGPLTAVGGTWMTRVAGPFAGETWWRFNVSAITGTFVVAGAIAVQ